MGHVLHAGGTGATGLGSLFCKHPGGCVLHRHRLGRVPSRGFARGANGERRQEGAGAKHIPGGRQRRFIAGPAAGSAGGTALRPAQHRSVCPGGDSGLPAAGAHRRLVQRTSGLLHRPSHTARTGHTRTLAAHGALLHGHAGSAHLLEVFLYGVHHQLLPRSIS